MQKRTMGIETEYGLLLRRSNGKFCQKPVNAKFLAHPWLTQTKTFDELYLFKDENDPTKGLWIGANGGKIYHDTVASSKDLDRAEYSSAECINGKDVALYDAAGDLLMQKVRESFMRSGAFKRMHCATHAHEDVVISKNNSDFIRPAEKPRESMHFYGSHENYIAYKRFFRVNEIDGFTECILPFLVSRTILHGSGGMWYTPESGWHYVISPRALATFRAEGRSAIYERPIIMSKDIGIDDRKKLYMRLHLVYGDSNMSPRSTWIRFDSTHLMLRVLEELGNEARLPVLENPMEALHAFATDTTLKAKAETHDHGHLTALDLQKLCIELVQKLELSDYEKAFAEYWASVVRRLEEDPLNLRKELDWVIKKNFIERSMARHGYDIRHEKARVLDVSYSELSPKGIYDRIEAAGGIEPLFAKKSVEAALQTPPPETRAALRSKYIIAVRKKFGKKSSGDCTLVRWESVHYAPKVRLDNPFATKSKRLTRVLNSKKFLNPAT